MIESVHGSITAVRFRCDTCILSWALRSSTISTVIVLVVLPAVDCALLRRPFGGNDAAMFRLCAPPMVSVLVFGLYLSIVRSHRGEKYPFLFGFEVFGWAALAAFLYGCEALPASLSIGLSPIFFTVHYLCMDNLPFEVMQSLDPTFAVTHEIATAVSLAAVSLVLVALLSIVALVGGWVVQRLRWNAELPG
jgi:hypothetical protein